jgi:hypothetical protein
MGRQNISSQKRPISNLDMPRQMAGDSNIVKESQNIFQMADHLKNIKEVYAE